MLLFNRDLEYRCGLSKSLDSFDPIEDSFYPIENNGVNEDPSILTDDPYILTDDPSILTDDSSILTDDPSILTDMDNDIHSWIESYLRYLDDSDNYNANISDLNSYILDDTNDSDLYEIENSNDTNDSDFTPIEYSNDTNNSKFTPIQYPDDPKDTSYTEKFKHLWVECESCFGLNYKKFFKSKMNICEHCGDHLKMSSSDRIELSIDPGTWNPMDEDMFSLDPIEWDKPYTEDEPSTEDEYDSSTEDEPYIDRLDFYQESTGLLEAVQTGTGQLNGIPVAIGIMDFQFLGGSMGSVVGEKITRLIEYATNQLLPLIIVCASGGARMQEGSLSLMQMAKISSADRKSVV